MMADSDCTRGRSNTSSVCTTLRSGPASGTRQLEYSLDVPGLVLRARLAHAIHQRGLQQHGRRLEQHLVHRLDDFLDVAFHIARHFRRDQAGLHETVHHRVAFGGGGSLELLDRAGQQVQLFAQLDVLERR